MANFAKNSSEAEFVPVDSLIAIKNDIHVVCLNCDYSSEWRDFIEKKSKKEWKRVSDDDIRLIFTCDTNACEMKGKEVFVAPSSLYDGGSPVCPECEDEMAFLRTEVKE